MLRFHYAHSDIQPCPRCRGPLIFEYDALVYIMYTSQHHCDGILDLVNTGQYNKVGDKMKNMQRQRCTRVNSLLRLHHREAEMFEAVVYDSSH